MPPVTQERNQTNEPTIQTSAGMETATQTANRARRMLEPTVSATELAEPTTPVRVPEPEQATIPVNPLGSAEQTLGNIRSQSERARQLEESNAAIDSFVDEQSAFDLQNEMLTKFGVTPDVLKQREEIGNQLASLIAANDFKKLDIASGGQGAQQGLRSLNQQDRETAVFAKQLEAQAAVLDGQINLGRQLAGDAVNMMLADRDLKYKNLIRQNQALASQVDEETQQLLLAENRRYEENLAEDQRFKANVDQAIASGAATSDEVAQLTAPLPTHPDPETQEQLQSQAIQERQSLAQAIQSRGANEMRDLDIAQTQASIGASRASEAANLALRDEREADRLIALAEAGNQDALDALGIITQENSSTQTDVYGEIEASAGGKPLGEGQIESLEKAQSVANQLGSLSRTFQNDDALNNVAGVDLAPITAIVRSNNPFDVKAREIEAQINSIVPNLARGIYGEVGVLTDQDVERYARTLPNLASTEEVREAMLGLTLKTVKNSVRNKLATNARSGRDVSGHIQTLEELEKTVGEAMLPVNQGTQEYQNLVSAGAPKEEVDSLLRQGYDLDEVINYYTGQ